MIYLEFNIYIINTHCSKLKGSSLHIPHPFATNILFVKLACVKHTTSVHPESGSSSFNYNLKYLYYDKLIKIKI